MGAMCREYLPQLCYFLLQIISVVSTNDCDFPIGGLVTAFIALEGNTFWKSKTTDAKDCARLCFRRKPCVSFNFDSGTLSCELNNDTNTAGKTTRWGKNLLYSDISGWPSQTDPNCYDRPCSDDEVCMPGFLAGGSTGCSHTCFKLEPRAVIIPGPPPTTNAPSPATTAPPPATTAPPPATTAPPSPTTTAPPPATTAPPSPTTAPPPATTAPPPATTASPPPTTTAPPPATTASPPTPTTAPPPATPAPPPATTAPPPATTASPPPTTTAPPPATTAPPPPTTTAPPPTTTTAPAQGDVRLQDGNTDGTSGRLEVRRAGETEYRSVELVEEMWNWEVTEVVCRQLGYNFGGAYHRKNKPYPTGSGGSYEFDGLDCTGSESSIFNCTYDAIRPKNGNGQDMGITCYTEDVNKQGFENIKLVDNGNEESMSGYIKVFYDGQWTRLCNEPKGTAPDVFCKTFNASWVEDAEGESNSDNSNDQMWATDIHCHFENVPHPFFCRNNGWEIISCNKYGTLTCQAS